MKDNLFVLFDIVGVIVSDFYEAGVKVIFSTTQDVAILGAAAI